MDAVTGFCGNEGVDEGVVGAAEDEGVDLASFQGVEVAAEDSFCLGGGEPAFLYEGDEEGGGFGKNLGLGREFVDFCGEVPGSDGGASGEDADAVIFGLLHGCFGEGDGDTEDVPVIFPDIISKLVLKGAEGEIGSGVAGDDDEGGTLGAEVVDGLASEGGDGLGGTTTIGGAEGVS